MGMFIIGKCFLFPSLENHEGFERLLHLITNIPLIAPLVWLAWFSALKYSQINKLKEDYAFKTATALALDGYREQADVDDVLDKKLLEIAITNFGENPLRLITQDTLKEAHPLASFLGKDSKPNK
jgi:hypothetical protein